MCANFKKNIFKMKKTILWMYNMPLVPEAGGTERITSLIRNGLLKATNPKNGKYTACLTFPTVFCTTL